MKLHQLDSFAQRHHGLINSTAVHAMGFSRSAWYRAIASEQFEQLYPNVARLWGSASTLPQHALAAVWAVGGDALTSHRTSAWLWGVERPDDDPIDVMMRSRLRHSLPSNVVIHRPRDLLDLRPIVRFQVPTTNPMRMLLDLGAVDPPAVEPAMITVMSSKVASPSAIRATLFRHAKQGRSGTTALRRALETWLDEELPPDSALEAAMALVVNAFRCPNFSFTQLLFGSKLTSSSSEQRLSSNVMVGFRMDSIETSSSSIESAMRKLSRLAI